MEANLELSVGELMLTVGETLGVTTGSLEQDIIPEKSIAIAINLIVRNIIK